MQVLRSEAHDSDFGKSPDSRRLCSVEGRYFPHECCFGGTESAGSAVHMLVWTIGFRLSHDYVPKKF